MNPQSNESDEPSCEVTDLSLTTVRSTIESLILSIAKSILDGDGYSFAVLSRSSSNHLLIPELDRPLLLSSFVISCPNAGVAGISALLSSMCYTEFSISIPAAGGAFSYLIVTFVARSFTQYLISVFGVEDPNSWRVEVPGFIKGYNMLDFPAVALIFILTLCLCYSTKESSLLNLIMTVFHVALLCFIIVVGFYKGSSKNLVSSGGIAPFGAKGVFDGAAIVYFSYIGYDSVSTLAEEIRKPSRNLPVGINGILEFAKVLRVQEQVVAGKLYHMTLVAVDGGMKKIYEATIWVKPWMNFKQLREFKSASNVSPFSTADLGLMRTL